MSDSTPNSSAPRAAAGDEIEQLAVYMQLVEGSIAVNVSTRAAAEFHAKVERLASLARQAGEMEKALKWYADENNWMNPPLGNIGGFRPVERDKGARAAAALKSAAPATAEGKV